MRTTFRPPAVSARARRAMRRAPCCRLQTRTLSITSQLVRGCVLLFGAWHPHVSKQRPMSSPEMGSEFKVGSRA